MKKNTQNVPTSINHLRYIFMGEIDRRIDFDQEPRLQKIKSYHRQSLILTFQSLLVFYVLSWFPNGRVHGYL